VEFRRANGLWQLASMQGRFVLDNEPQLKLERERTISERNRLMKECVALAHQRSELIKLRSQAISSGDAEQQTAVEADLTRQMELSRFNNWNREAAFHAQETTTPKVARSVPAFAVAAGAALLPGVWAVVTIRRNAQRRSRAAAGRCIACGYDLRATPGRCPECGTAPAVHDV
jgi:hypothetical protein